MTLCIGDVFNPGLYHAFKKSGLRISIKDYRGRIPESDAAAIVGDDSHHEPEHRAPARLVEIPQVRAERELDAPTTVHGPKARLWNRGSFP